MATVLVPLGIHLATSQQAARVGAVRHCMRSPRTPKDAHCLCGAVLQNTASHVVIPVRRESGRRVTNINRLCPTRRVTCKEALLSPAQSGRLYSKQICLALGGSSAVAAVAGTTALNFLADQAVFGNQPVPRHFAAVPSTKRCTVGLIKPCKSDRSAVHRAVSSVRIPVSVLPGRT